MNKGWKSLNLTPTSRANLLSIFPPKYSKTIAHHVTLAFGFVDDGKIPDYKNVQVVGYATDGEIECVVVELDSNSKRPDGSLYHITLSLNPSTRKPVDSNKILKMGYDRVSTSSQIYLETTYAFNKLQSN